MPTEFTEMVRRSGETSITLPPTKDWRALEQIRWSKLERVSIFESRGIKGDEGERLGN
jgi:hypothetical protein